MAAMLQAVIMGALIKAAAIFRADITTEVSDSNCGSCRKIAIPHIVPS